MSARKIRFATWNVSGGLFEPAEDGKPDVGYLARCLGSLDADIVCLQEVLTSGHSEKSQAAELAGELKYDFCEWGIGPSHLMDGARMGLAILSRTTIVNSERLPLPGIMVRDASNCTPHDKGILRAEIEWEGQPVSVLCAQLIPFHRWFQLAPDRADLPVLEPLRSAMTSYITREMASRPILIGADLNLNLKQASHFLSKLPPDLQLEQVIQVPGRPDGRQTDHILISKHWNAERSWVIPTRSDHSLCVTDIALAASRQSAQVLARNTGRNTTILHLSDLHFGPGSVQDENDVDWKTPLADAARQKRADRLKPALQALPNPPDFVVITGDLTVAGNEAGYTYFNKMVDDLIKIGCFPRADHIVVVPGNHDVARRAHVFDDNTSLRWKGFLSSVGGRFVHPWIPAAPEAPGRDEMKALACRTMTAEDAYWGGVYRDDKTRRDASLPFIYDRSQGLLVYAFNSASVSQTSILIPKEVQDDVQWLRKLKDPNQDKINRVLDAYEQELQVDAARVDPHEIELFVDICEELKTRDGDGFDGALKVAALHHHVAPMLSEEVKKFETLLNAGRFKRKLQEAGFHVIMHGHKHWPEPFLDSAVAGGGSHVVVSGGTIAGWEASGCTPGFFWIEHDRPAVKLDVRYVNLLDSPRSAFRQAKSTSFVLPRPQARIGEARSLVSYDLERVFRDTERQLAALLREQPDSSGSTLVGWSHVLDGEFVSMIATAYGLAIMHLIDTEKPKLLRETHNIVRTLANMRRDGGGWGASSQVTESGQVEATAWALAAMQRHCAYSHEVQEGLDFLERTIPDDVVLWENVFSLSLVLRVMVEINPQSPLIRPMAETLVRSAGRGIDGQIAWGRKTHHVITSDQKTDRVVPGGAVQHFFKPSAVHTAHAAISLMKVHRATDGECGLGAEALAGASAWLLDQRDWVSLDEVISRLPPKWHRRRGTLTTLRVQHFTAPWVIYALLLIGVAPDHQRILTEVRGILDQQEEGLWNWGPIRRPIWATHDALMALKLFALRSGREL